MRFFYGVVFREFPLSVLAFFYSSTLLRLLCGGFSGSNSCAGGGRGESRFFVWKILYFCPKNPAAKSSLFVTLAL